jgi:hypothetical protein
VKLAAGHPRAPYRNDAIFRSAERLISSTSHRPSGNRIPRLVFFVSGVACGLLLAFLLFRSNRPESTPAFSAANRPASTVSEPLSQTSSTQARVAIALDAPAPTNTPPHPTDALAAPITAAHLPPPNANSTTLIPPTASPLTRASNFAIPAPLLAITSSTTRIVLQGELRSTLPAVAPIAVKFELQFVPARTGLSGSLSGVVTFEEYGPPAPTLRLYGSFTPHAIILRELRKIPDGASHAGHGYEFLIDRSDANDTGELSGTWTHGANRGPLVVKSALAL